MKAESNSLVGIALKAALSGAKEILEVYGSAFQVELKEDKSPLTLADKNAHRAISSTLLMTKLAILSEEGKQLPYNTRRNWTAFWMIDPLDGTKEFVKRNGEFTVNIALINDGKPVWGVVYAPVLKTMYWGGKDDGAFKAENVSPQDSLQDIEAKAVRIRAVGEASPYIVVGSRSHSSRETDKFIEELKMEKGEIEFISMGSSLKICLVAEGKAQIYPRFAPTMEWDTAAGHAVALGAGCKVITPDTHEDLLYNKENLLNPWFIVNP